MIKFEIKSNNQIIQSKILHCNLTLIDSDLPEIIIFIMNLNFKHISLFDLIKLLENENPIKYDDTQGHWFYYAKLIKFVNAVLGGVNANDVWTGIENKRFSLFECNNLHCDFDLAVLDCAYFERVLLGDGTCKLLVHLNIECRESD
ncbi:HpaII family restriction endonuclease [Marinicellulosiphila megalodicopiae]|uniref:HpaII family restriction endonuclease n=1 Tax=Marinicellulosiphila megalodicopiae TaxID=2724896 RepID=UPI003BB06208